MLSELTSCVPLARPRWSATMTMREKKRAGDLSNDPVEKKMTRTTNRLYR
jgi:hypothetical protein